MKPLVTVAVVGLAGWITLADEPAGRAAPETAGG
jgi:hypothetical protein